MNSLLTAVVASALLAGLAPAPSTAPQAQRPAPPAAPLTFGSEVELVNVDAVVVDRQGNPVLGLKREDFTLEEEGVPQTISTFEAVPPAPPPASGAPPRRPFISTNMTRSAHPGRIFAVLFDDMHMSPQQAYRAKLAVAEFLQNGVHAGDDVMLVPSSGGGWWSGRMPYARDELMGVLKHYEGRQFGSSVAQDTMTDYEAMLITTRQDANAVDVVTRRFESAGLSAQLARDKDDPTPRLVNSYLDERAREAYNQALARDRVTLGTLSRLLDALAAGKGRKAVVLVSRGFILNAEVSEFRQTVDAARRANAAIYFLDARGLRSGLSAFAAEFGNGAGIAADPMLLYADMTTEAEGSDALASETGGFSVHHSSDLAAGINRIAKESRGYYLLGYSPKETFEDGRFRRIGVRVNRRGVTVRARKGYFAPSPGLVVKKERAEDEPDPQLQQAVDAPFDADSIPLRVTAYTSGETLIDRAKVHVAADIDIRNLAFERKEDRLIDALDVLLLVSQRETGEVFQYSERVEMRLRPQTLAKTPWFPMLHEFDLGTGSYQARLVVRDENNKKLGSVLHSFELPELGALRVSTPILSDTPTPESKGSAVPQLLPLARRTFYARGPLYVQFEVYNAARDASSGKPVVRSGHRLVAHDGRVVADAQPSAIEVPSSGTVSRLMSLALDGVVPGEYELVITIADTVAGKTLELREALTVEPAEAAPPT